MKISKLEELLLKNASKVNIIRGQKLLDENKLIKLNVNKIDNFYNIYGNFKSENKLQTYSSHIKLDIKNEMIVKCTCNCDIYKEGSRGTRTYYCEHIVSTGLKYISAIKAKINAKQSNEVDNKVDILKLINSRLDEKREQLDIFLSVKAVNEKKNEFFDINFFIGEKKSLPLLNVDECFKAFKERKKYLIGKGIIYDDNKYYFNENSKKLIDTIYEYILIAPQIVNKNSIRIPSSLLKRILENVDAKKIKFHYNFQNYVCDVKCENLPISFSLKNNKNTYILTTKKVLPIPLDKNMDIWLYDRNIYIPTKIQNEIYSILYKEISKNRSIIFNEENKSETLFNIIEILNRISNNVKFDEEIISIINDNIDINLNFKEEKSKLFCDVKLNTPISSVDYREAIKSEEIFAPKSKLIHIESILNKSRFYFRNNLFEFLGNEDEYYEFLKNGIVNIQKEAKVVCESKYFKFNKCIIENIDLKKNNDDKYNLKVNFKDLSNKMLKQIEDSYRDKKSYIKLDDGTYVDLNSEEIEFIMDLMDNLNIDLKDERDEYEIELNKLFYLEHKLNDDLLVLNKDTCNKIKEIINNDVKQKEYKVPKSLNTKLRKYQEEGFNWLKNIKKLNLGGILSDEMGLGKTIQTISFLLSEHEKIKGISLVIVPTSLLYNWKEEFCKFAPSLKIGIVHGKENKNIVNVNEFDIVLTTYGFVRINCNDFYNIDFENIILDEGQNINNPKTQISKVIKKIKGKNKFVLTGTPIENNLNELWSLFDFIMKGYLHTFEEFKNRFVKQDNLEELRTLISPYILRREKKDVLLELPQKNEINYFVENTYEQDKIYKGFTKEIKENIKNENNSIVIFSYLTKIRQICLDPSLIIEGYSGGSGKINFIKEYVKNNKHKHKILLFSQFTSVLKKIEEYLSDENIENLYLDGSTPSKKRIDMVDEFNKNKDIRIFLISLKAGGTGLNLTSADTVIHFDPWWNPSIENQATDRAHRIGQKSDVNVLKLIAKNTIEEKILKLQEEKSNLINSIITNDLNDNNIIKKLNKDELINLL